MIMIYLGFAIQYGKSDTDIGSSGTNVDSENINLSIYRTRPLMMIISLKECLVLV